MKNYHKDTASSYLAYQMLTNCMDGQCLKKRPVNGFKQVEDLPQFKENFMKNYQKNNDKEYFPEVDFEYPKKII